VALIAAVLVTAPDVAAGRKSCRRGCATFQRGCVKLARAKLGTERPTCAGDASARRSCRKAAKKRFRAKERDCKRFAKRSCKPCCREGAAGSCAPAAGYPLPAEPQEGGDPVVGRELLLNGDFMTCGLPAKLWTSDLGLDRLLARGFAGSADAPRIPDRNEKNAEMPYFLNVFTADNGAEVVNANCLMCHGGLFNGELVIGLGNATADFTAGAGGGSAGIPVGEAALNALGLTEAEKEQFRKIQARGAVLEPLTKMRTVGMNPAELFAVILMVHHDRETLAWSDEEVTPLVMRDENGDPIEYRLLTSDPPPWWRAHKKHALFYNGMARGDHRGTMALATSVCVDDVARAREVDEMFRHIQAFVNSVRPPAYPFPIDPALAAQGHGVFRDACARCHGTYSDVEAEETYPNLLIPLADVGTDPAVANAGVVHSPELVDWYNGSFYGQITRMVPDDPFPGYMPPPLDGIWATAPFLHNGSVPTVELLLNSGARPTYWKRVDLDSTNFDQEALGWPYVVLQDPPERAPAAERRLIYDTTHWSQSNAGHTFGDHLTSSERRALIEYLKTL
jgi:mono/diheme cytochrome c family protein